MVNHLHIPKLLILFGKFYLVLSQTFLKHRLLLRHLTDVRIDCFKLLLQLPDYLLLLLLVRLCPKKF